MRLIGITGGVGAGKVPWMGLFMATLSPKERCIKLEEDSSGMGLRLPYMVVIKPCSLAFATRLSKYSLTLG